MRFIIALALSFAAVVTAAPPAQAAGAGTLVARQQCTVDCTCLAPDRNRSWPDTQRCCVPNGGTLDTPVCDRPAISYPAQSPIPLAYQVGN